MRKRTRLTESKNKFVEDDYKSALPDDILVTILSRLTLKEAVVTGILSRRRCYLWTHVAGLDFDANDALDRIAADPKLRSSERPKYINWVNRVLRQHRGPILDCVRICFDLDKISKSAIDNWVKFAIAKRVQRLELDLLENGETLRQPMRNYTFPVKHLSKGLSLKNAYSNFALMQPSVLSGFKCLEALSFKSVKMSVKKLWIFSFPAVQF